MALGIYRQSDVAHFVFLRCFGGRGGIVLVRENPSFSFRLSYFFLFFLFVCRLALGLPSLPRLRPYLFAQESQRCKNIGPIRNQYEEGRCPLQRVGPLLEERWLGTLNDRIRTT